MRCKIVAALPDSGSTHAVAQRRNIGTNMRASSIQHRASCFSCGSVQRLEFEVDALEKVGLKPHWNGLSSVRQSDFKSIERNDRLVAVSKLHRGSRYSIAAPLARLS